MSVEISKLASGLTVVTDNMPHLETAALGVWAGVGGRDEKPNEHGISHLLEHMAFKGTTGRSSREIVEEIEAVGGDLNAGTSTETTSYYARVMKADVPLALDVLADILANPAFEPEELEREKNVIVQEIGAAQDTPDDVVFEWWRRPAPSITNRSSPRPRSALPVLMRRRGRSRKRRCSARAAPRSCIASWSRRI
jgi:predicted Zn-dependent peptidase